MIFSTAAMVFAARARVGMMGGARRNAIPADTRFYAGGGGSVRGYPFQTLGPLAGDEPMGGRSLIEFSAELRVKFADRVGFTAFLDGGSAFGSVIPDAEERVRLGTGLGFRYFTPIGPVRLDVGFPLNRREDIDDFFQVYISLGQAF